MKHLNTKTNLPQFLLIFVFLINYFFISFSYAQATITDTLRETTTNEIRWVRTSNEYFSWYEYGDTEKRVFLGEGNNVESQIVDPTYLSCSNSFSRLNIYNDFVYLWLDDFNNRAFCDRGFVWGPSDELVQDPRNIGEIEGSQFENYFFNHNEELIDVITGARHQLVIPQTSEYRFWITNVIAINNSFVYLKAVEISLSTGQSRNNVIYSYNRQNGAYTELFSSPYFLHFKQNTTYADDASLIFSESIVGDDVNLYYLRGNQMELITGKRITNSQANPFLDGVVYVANDSLYYWEDGNTLVLSDDVFHTRMDNCKIMWFSGYGDNSSLHFYDGSKSESISYSGHDDETYGTLQFVADTSFLFNLTSLDFSTEYLIRGNHKLNNPNPNTCDYPDSYLTDDRSYFKVKNLTSDVVLNKAKTIYRATESIRLLPGFHAKANSSFHGEIVNCTPQSAIAQASPRNNHKMAYSLPVVSPTSASLTQNTPNPFSYGPTKIDYFIPKNSRTASINIFNNWGQIIQQIPISNNGTGTIEIEAADFIGGIYHYSLVVDGKIEASKKMIVIK